MKRLTLALCLLTLPASAESEIRLFVLDCGHATLSDASPVSDTGEYDGRKLELADPCFLVQHPRGYLLWDAGLPPSASYPPLNEQLRTLGLAADEISLLAFSHLHFDHVGNANMFPRATWLMNRAELAWAEAEPAHFSMEPALFSAHHNATTRMIDGDHDVFGDGRVRIFHVPGHTPGSQVLWLKLAHQTILLSGDLYLQRESRRDGLVPTVNADRAQTLASQARVERIAHRTHARVIVQHDQRDYAQLPKLPRYLD
jgi:N-acyl homoserine lactone hydrolase